MPDLVTLADVKRHLGTAATSDDALLSSLITQVSSAVASRLSRELLTGARTETRDGNGKTKLVLNDYPVTAVSSVVVDGIAIPPAPDVLTPGYRFSSTAITLNGYCFARGQQNVELAYTAGFAAVPEDVQLAVLDTVALAYKQRDHLDVSSKSLAGETISYITTDLTPAAKARLAPYRRTFSF